MASASRTLLTLALAGGLAVGAYFVVTAGSEGVDEIGSVGFDLDDVESVEEDDGELLELEAQRGELEDRVAAESSAGPKDGATRVDVRAAPDAELTLVGRVVSASGSAVADAEVNLFMRRDLEAFFRNGGGRNFRRGGRDRSFFETFRLKRVAKTVRTGKDGRFRFVGPAYASSTVEVGVTHTTFAPSTVRRDWEVAKGELDVGDIKVESGAKVYGRVVSSSGQPLEGAEVRWQGSGNARARGGRRGRGGPGGRRGGFFGPGGSPLEQLVGVAKADARGAFELGPLPQGEFKLRATLERYLDGESEDLAAEAAGRVDAGVLQLTLGSEIRGVVLDENGQGIADATVRGRTSFRGDRGPGQDNGGPGAPGGRNRGERGNRGDRGNRRGGRGGPGGPFGRGTTRETKTDKDGKFTLNALPLGALRLDVSHPRFVSEQRDPIDPAKDARIEFRLDKRTSLQGLVVDARTGQPITNYGIEARKSRGRRGGDFGRFDRGNRGNRRNRGDETANAEAAARAAERTARAQQEAAYRARYFGPSGEAPQRRPKPEAHAEGRFVVDGIDPGTWMLDVVAPGYASVADGPIEVERGKPVTETRTIRLVPASSLRGVVSSSTTKKGLRRASVELFVPPMPSVAAPSNGDDPRNAMRRMFRGRGGDQGTRMGRTRTNDAGEFEFDTLRPGTYRVVVRAQDHLEATIDKVVVAGGRANERNVVLGVGGTLRGTVRGYKPGMRLRLRHEKDGNARADIEKDGSYEVKGLRPGGWFVSVEQNGGDFGRRGASMFRQFLGDNKPDVYVQENRVVTFEVDPAAEATCTVSGTVLANGMAGEGYTVSLEAAPNASQGADDGRNFMRRMTSRFLRSNTKADGSFEVENIPAGSWILKLARSSGRGGDRGGRGRGFGGGDSTIESMPITLVAGQSFSHNFNVRVGGIELDLRNKSGMPISRASVEIAFASEANGKAREEWRALPSYRRLRLDKGVAKAEGLRQGRWSYIVRGTGIEETVRQVFVGGGDIPVEVVEISVDEAAVKKAEAEREKRRAEREAERALRQAQNGGEARGGNRRNNRGGGRRGNR